MNRIGWLKYTRGYIYIYTTYENELHDMTRLHITRHSLWPVQYIRNKNQLIIQLNKLAQIKKNML